MRLREARVLMQEIESWPPPLACWLGLWTDAAPITVQGSDITRGPDARWHIVPEYPVFGGGPRGRPGLRGAPPIGPYR